MSRDEMLLRHGFYCGMADRVLGDASYGARWYGRAHELDEAAYIQTATEIQARLVAAGAIGPDEDPFLTAYPEFAGL